MISLRIALYCWIALAWIYIAYFAAYLISKVTPQSLEFVLDWMHAYLAHWFLIMPILLLPPLFAMRRAYRWLEVEKFVSALGKKWSGRLLIAIGHVGLPMYMPYFALMLFQPSGGNSSGGAGLGLGLAMAAVFSHSFYTLGLLLATADLLAAKKSGHQRQQPKDVDEVLKKLGSKFSVHIQD